MQGYAMLDSLRATRPRRIALCAALFWVVWSWHFLFALWFLPTMVSFSRDQNKWPVVFLANLALGWTPLWFVILGFAMWSQNPVTPLPRNAVLVTVKTRTL